MLFPKGGLPSVLNTLSLTAVKTLCQPDGMGFTKIPLSEGVEFFPEAGLLAQPTSMTDLGISVFFQIWIFGQKRASTLHLSWNIAQSSVHARWGLPDSLSLLSDQRMSFAVQTAAKEKSGAILLTSPTIFLHPHDKEAIMMTQAQAQVALRDIWPWVWGIRLENSQVVYRFNSFFQTFVLLSGMIIIPMNTKGSVMKIVLISKLSHWCYLKCLCTWFSLHFDAICVLMAEVTIGNLMVGKLPITFGCEKCSDYLTDAESVASFLDSILTLPSFFFFLLSSQLFQHCV